MSQAFRTIKGTFDILPEAHAADGTPVAGSTEWQCVEARIRDVMARFHFAEIRSPILEDLHLFERSVGQTSDIVTKEMFAVEREKETYVLRPEVTASVMRAYVQHRLDQKGGVQRLYYMGPCFRAERPQRGRYRQFHQFGAELIGSADPRADVEVIALMMALYDAFGLADTCLRINSLGHAESRAAYRAALKAYLEPYADDLSETSRQRLETNPLRILDTKNVREQAMLVEAPVLLDFLSAEDTQRYETVRMLLSELEIPFVEDPFLVRGLDYYAQTAFELESEDLGAQSALGGGGRYDGLAEEIGSKQPVPGVGFAAGFERLFLALQAQHIELGVAPKPDVFLVALGDEAQRWSFIQAQQLRRHGLKVAFDLIGRSMKAQMKEANRQEAPFTVIVGDAELAQGAVVVKEMDSGDQQTVPFSDLPETLLGLKRSHPSLTA